MVAAFSADCCAKSLVLTEEFTMSSLGKVVDAEYETTEFSAAPAIRRFAAELVEPLRSSAPSWREVSA